MIYRYAANGCFDTKVFKISVSGMPFFNTPMWFFVTLFSVNVTYFILRKLPSYIVNVIIILFFFAAWRMEGSSTAQYLMHRAFPLAIVYFHIGYVFRNYQNYINWKICIACIVLCIFINLVDQQCIWFVNNFQSQGYYPFNLFYSLCATLSLWFIFKNLLPKPDRNKAIKALNLLGRYSLIVFATHRPILNYVYEPIIRRLWPNVNYYAFLIIGLFILIVASIALYKLIIRLTPKLVGA